MCDAPAQCGKYAHVSYQSSPLGNRSSFLVLPSQHRDKSVRIGGTKVVPTSRHTHSFLPRARTSIYLLRAATNKTKTHRSISIEMVLPGFHAARQQEKNEQASAGEQYKEASRRRQTGEALSAWYSELCRQPSGPRSNVTASEEECMTNPDTPAETNQALDADADADDDGAAGLFCMLCDVIVSPAEAFDAHCTSLSHQFRRANSGKKDSQLGLDPSNRGYRLLERLGWSEAEGCGLGVRRQGRVAPIPTQLRDNRTGLGHERKRARVTHFPRHNEHEAHCAEDGLSRAQREQVARWSRGTLFRPELRSSRADSGVQSHGDGTRPTTHPPGPPSRQQREAQLAEEARRSRRVAALLRTDIPAGMESVLAEGQSAPSRKRRRKR